MSAPVTHLRRLLARRPTLRLWYAALVFVWMFGFGGLALLMAQMGQCPPGGCDRMRDLLHVLAIIAAELWPPVSLSGAGFLLLFWLPVLAAPFGLTRPVFKELY